MVSLPKETKLAILIDAENMSAAWVRPVLARLQSSRVLTLKRAYGDWSRPHLSGWKPVLTEYGIRPVHAITYVAGKNTADMMLTIDAIDLLYQQVNWFCIISNDSDFTPLVHRLTEAGAKVLGFGSNQVSQAFANACYKFFCIEPLPNLQPTAANPATALHSERKQSVSRAVIADAARAELLQWLKIVYLSFADPNAWVDLGRFGSELRKQYPEFDPKQFGYSALGKLIAIEGGQLFEMRRRPVDDTNPHYLVVQLRLRTVT